MNTKAFITLSLVVLASCMEEQLNPLKDHVSATCSDGSLNQDEEDIDCGGICDACPEPLSSPCQSALLDNYFFDDRNFVQMDFTNVTCSYDLAKDAFVIEADGDKGDITITINSDSLPEGDQIYKVSQDLSSGDYVAGIYMSSYTYGFYNATLGDLYIIYNDNNEAEFEFCEVRFLNTYSNFNGYGRVICE